MKEVHIYTCRKSVYNRIRKKIGEPAKIFYTDGKISGANWIIPFKDKRQITSILSRILLIGQIQ